MVRYDLREEMPPLFCEVQAIDPALGASLYEAPLLHTIQQLRHVALGDEQGVS